MDLKELLISFQKKLYLKLFKNGYFFQTNSSQGIFIPKAAQNDSQGELGETGAKEDSSLILPPPIERKKRTSVVQKVENLQESLEETQKTQNALVGSQNNISEQLSALEEKVTLTNSELELLQGIGEKQLETTVFLQKFEKNSLSDISSQVLMEKLMELSKQFVENQEKFISVIQKTVVSNDRLANIFERYSSEFRQIDQRLIAASQAGELKIHELLATLKKDFLPVLNSFYETQCLTNLLFENF